MKASDLIASFLKKKGIQCVFELSGGMITHILDSLHQTTDIKIVTVHHEQSAAFAAEGYARVTNLPGVALATSGPGATNLLTGIGSCFFDSTPAIFITGQVNRAEQKGNKPIRQLGFQETDIVAMAKPITKACFLVNNPDELEDTLNKAFDIAMEGRPGPVLIDIPMDVQRSQILEKQPIPSSPSLLAIDESVLIELIADIEKARNPLILVGRGVRAAGSKKLLDEFVERTQVPVITSLLGLDCVDFLNPLRVGFIGSYGNRWANTAFGDCDLLVVLGSRLDIRQTGADTKFIEKRKIYHVDCEQGEINNRIHGCVPIVTDLKTFFSEFERIAKNHAFKIKEDWLNQIQKLREKWPDTKELSPLGINPNNFMHILSRESQNAKGYLADVGSHQMWAAQSLEISHEQVFLTSGGMGAMGFALPASIGACFGLNLEPVVTILGDGCMQLNIQELQTIVRNKLPIKIIVMNNQTLGMIRQFQDSYFDSRYQSTYWGYSAPDFSKIANAYGILTQTIERAEEIENAVKWLWTDDNMDKPQLLQVMIDPHTNTYPKIAFGRPITEMEPFVKPLEMEST